MATDDLLGTMHGGTSQGKTDRGEYIIHFQYLKDLDSKGKDTGKGGTASKTFYKTREQVQQAKGNIQKFFSGSSQEIARKIDVLCAQMLKSGVHFDSINWKELKALKK